jgi:hypothetical protein
MAAFVAAMVIRLWHANLAARFAVLVLMATQMIIGADVYFIPSHAMITSPVKRVADLLAQGYKKQYRERLDVFDGWVAIGKALPPDAHVMLHENHVHLGLSRRTTSDWGAWQFGISYGRLVTPRAVYDRYRELGVTHLVWVDGVAEGWDSLAGDLVFFDFALRRTVEPRRVGSHTIARMPDQPPPNEAGMVAVFGTKGYYKDGLYRIEDLRTPVFGPDRTKFAPPVEALEEDGEDELLAKADFVVLDSSYGRGLESRVTQEFRLAAKRKLVNLARGRGRSTWGIYLRE